jgi:hypothetical protein
MNANKQFKKKTLYGNLALLCSSSFVVLSIVATHALIDTYGRSWESAFDTTKTLHGRLVPGRAPLKASYPTVVLVTEDGQKRVLMCGRYTGKVYCIPDNLGAHGFPSTSVVATVSAQNPYWVQSVRTVDGVEVLKNEVSAFSARSASTAWSYVVWCLASLAGAVGFYRQYRWE